MFVLIHKATKKICDVHAKTFPVHEDFEWVERNDIGREKVGHELRGDTVVEPQPLPEREDVIKMLTRRIEELERIVQTLTKK